jgi:hypothetical protein
MKVKCTKRKRLDDDMDEQTLSQESASRSVVKKAKPATKDGEDLHDSEMASPTWPERSTTEQGNEEIMNGMRHLSV